MQYFKSIVIPSFIALSLLLSGCIPVCCGKHRNDTESLQTLKYLEIDKESTKRKMIFERFLDNTAKRQYDELVALYAKETRDMIKKPYDKLGNTRSDEQLESYIKGMREFEFLEEKITQCKKETCWMLSYQHNERKKQHIIYYLILEKDEYKILDQRFLTLP